MHIKPENLHRAKRIAIEEYGSEDGLANLDDETAKEAMSLIQDIAHDMQVNQLKYFRPFQWQYNFWDLGAHSSRRACIAGNRTGKTISTCFETACHLTGIYPKWWKGKQYKTAITCIAMGDSWEDLSKTLQHKLLGVYDINQRGEVGYGLIPQENIDFDSIRTDGSNCKMLRVKHSSGGSSTLWFGVYTQDRSHLQGFELHLVLFDEQPPDELYSELVTRLATTNGHAICSFTPLKGATGLVQKFEEHETGYDFIRVGWDDVPEYNDWGEAFFLNETREQLARDYMPHERDARMRGIPMVGVGAIFPLLKFPTYNPGQFNPNNYPDFERIISLDLGLVNDPTVITFAVRDPFEEIIYIHRQITLLDTVVDKYVHHLTHDDCQGIPIVLPADANVRGRYTLDEGSVRSILYDKYRLNVVEKPIMNPPDASGKVNNRIDFGINVMRQMMEDTPPKLQIHESCRELLTEMRNLYVDEKGRYSGRDDCIDSARYAVLGFLNGYGACKDVRRFMKTRKSDFRAIREAFKVPQRPVVKDLYKG